MSDNTISTSLTIDDIKFERKGMSSYQLNLDDADVFVGKKKITIYVIYHDTFENTNVFTTNYNKIPYIVKKLAEDNQTDIKEWQYREIPEEEFFVAVMNDEPF